VRIFDINSKASKRTSDGELTLEIGVSNIIIKANEKKTDGTGGRAARSRAQKCKLLAAVDSDGASAGVIGKASRDTKKSRRKPRVQNTKRMILQLLAAVVRQGVPSVNGAQ
jgi:hypothetical protein